MILFALLLMAGAGDPPPAATTPTPAAIAVGAPGSAAAGAPVQPAYADQVTCRREAQPNSIVTKRVCLTNAQWMQRAKEDQDAVHDMQQHGLTGGVAGSGAGGHP